MSKVEIIATKAKSGKKSHLIDGQSYFVTEKMAKILVEKGAAKYKGAAKSESKEEAKEAPKSTRKKQPEKSTSKK